MLLKFRAFYLFKREWGRKPQNLSYSLQILLLAFCSCWGGEKKPTRGESKHFTGKYTLALSHPHLQGENKYLLRNGLKTFLLSIVVWEQGWVAICQSPATGLNFGFFSFLGFFFGRMVKERSKQRSCGCCRALGCALSMACAPFAGDCVCSEYSPRLPAA